jgi:O-antigen/teichoic acid export membrane protein
MSTIDFRNFFRLAKEGSWIIIGQIATVAGALVLVRVLTENLTPTEYGHLALGLTVALLMNQVVMGGINSGIGRFYSIAAEKHCLQGYLKSSMKLLGYGTLMVMTFGLVFIVFLLWLGYSQWIGLVAAVLVFSLLTAYNSSLNGIQNAARQRIIVAFHGGLDSWLKILLAMGVMFWLGATSTAVVLGYICSLVVVNISQLFFLGRTIPKHNSIHEDTQSWTKQIWTYSWPFSVWGIFTWLQFASDRWALVGYASTESVGQYAVLYQLGFVPLTLLTGMAVSFIGPIFYQKSGDATDASRNVIVHNIGWKITYICLFMTILIFVIFFSRHEWIFHLLVATEYHAVSYLLPWVALSGGFFAASQMLSLKLMSEMKSVTMITVKVVTAITGVVFNITGAALAGLPGVVIALVAASVIYFIWMSILCRIKN